MAMFHSSPNAEFPLTDVGSQVLVLTGRILLSLLFITSGYGKIFTTSAFAQLMATKGMPVPEAFPYMAIVIELVGGIALLLGIRTRLLAVLFVIYLIVATLISHSFWLDQGAARAANSVQFYKNLAIMGGFVFLGLIGGGRYSVDEFLRQKSA